MTQEALAWDAHRDRWQRLVNERPIPARRAQVFAPAPIPVTARLEWERDGVEHLDTVAWAWTTRTVLVELHDPRRQIIGVWLPAGDVRRTESLSPSPPDATLGPCALPARQRPSPRSR